MIWHPRSEWVTTEPVTGPLMPWASVDAIVIHYTAAPNLIDGDPGERWELLPAYIRSIHHDYLTNRPQPNGATGYSIGYNVGVDQRGHAWELRGFDTQAAATKGHNGHTWAILVFVDGQDQCSPEAVATIRELGGLAEAHTGRPLRVRGHRDFIPTQCPGLGVYAQITAGAFSPIAPAPVDPVEPPPIEVPEPPAPIVPQPQEDHDVIKLIVQVPGDTKRAEALVAIDGAGVTMIGFASVEDRNALVAQLEVRPTPISAAQYDDLVAHALADRKG